MTTIGTMQQRLRYAYDIAKKCVIYVCKSFGAKMSAKLYRSSHERLTYDNVGITKKIVIVSYNVRNVNFVFLIINKLRAFHNYPTVFVQKAEKTENKRLKYAILGIEEDKKQLKNVLSGILELSKWDNLSHIEAIYG